MFNIKHFGLLLLVYTKALTAIALTVDFGGLLKFSFIKLISSFKNWILMEGIMIILISGLEFLRWQSFKKKEHVVSR